MHLPGPEARTGTEKDHSHDSRSPSLIAGRWKRKWQFAHVTVTTGMMLPWTGCLYSGSRTPKKWRSFSTAQLRSPHNGQPARTFDLKWSITFSCLGDESGMLPSRPLSNCKWMVTEYQRGKGRRRSRRTEPSPDPAGDPGRRRHADRQERVPHVAPLSRTLRSCPVLNQSENGNVLTRVSLADDNQL